MTIIISLAISIPLAVIFFIIGFLIRKKRNSKIERNTLSTSKNKPWILKEFLYNLEYVFYFLAILFLIGGIAIAITL